VPHPLDAATVRAWCAAALAGLTAARGEIDALNVYPVADRDTGTNLVLTMRGAALAVDKSLAVLESASAGRTDVQAVLAAMVDGALVGARGNSGVILSQLLLGVAEALSERAACGGPELAGALRRADGRAYAAVAAPVEGTILTVLSAAARAATEVEADGPVAVALAAADAAAAATRRTTEQLTALSSAGVVDAGGRGLCVLLDALVAVVTGTPVEGAGAAGRLTAADSRPLVAAPAQVLGEHEYEVQFLLEAPAEAVDRLRLSLATVGSSLAVVGQPPTWKVHVHVHVQQIGTAIEAGIVAGRLSQLRVTRFAEWSATRLPEARRGRAVVVVTDGEGLRALFEAEGAVVLAGRPPVGLSPADLLDAVTATGAAEVVVLPNDPVGHAEAVDVAGSARSLGIDVAVVPTRSPVQGLAALAMADPARRFGDDVIAMTSAAGATRWAELSVAGRDAITTAGVCRAGNVLGVIEGDVALIGEDLAACTLDLVERMLAGGGELVTAVLGVTAPAGLGEILTRRLRRTRPGVEVVAYDGGQPEPPVLLGVE